MSLSLASAQHHRRPGARSAFKFDHAHRFRLGQSFDVSADFFPGYRAPSSANSLTADLLHDRFGSNADKLYVNAARPLHPLSRRMPWLISNVCVGP